MRFPLAAMGGGHQDELLLLQALDREESSFFGIDEPEAHLHPELIRQLLTRFLDVSKDKQIFITTHSTMLVDSSEIATLWLTKHDRRETEVTPVQSIDKFGDVLFELGSRPSDIFLANAIVFVEGKSDEVVYSIWARKLWADSDFDKVRFIPTHGETRGKYYLDVWIPATQAAGTPFYMILDKGAARDRGAKKFLDNGSLKLGENLFLLQNGELEDYYDFESLVMALQEEYNIKLSEEERTKLSAGARVKQIDALLKQKKKDFPKTWKVDLGRRVAGLMERDAIPGEILDILERIRTNFRRH